MGIQKGNQKAVLVSSSAIGRVKDLHKVHSKTCDIKRHTWKVRAVEVSEKSVVSVGYTGDIIALGLVVRDWTGTMFRIVPRIVGIAFGEGSMRLDVKVRSKGEFGLKTGHYIERDRE